MRGKDLLSRALGIGILGFLAALLFSSAAEAACEECHRPWLTPWNTWCVPVSGDDVGATLCHDEVTLVSITCQEDGNACQVITVIGGGGGSGTGSGGGTSNPCQTSGFCPAECFTCSGGGGGGIPAG